MEDSSNEGGFSPLAPFPPPMPLMHTAMYLLVSGMVALELGVGVTSVVTATVDRKREQHIAITCSIPEHGWIIGKAGAL